MVSGIGRVSHLRLHAAMAAGDVQIVADMEAFVEKYFVLKTAGGAALTPAPAAMDLSGFSPEECYICCVARACCRR